MSVNHAPQAYLQSKLETATPVEVVTLIYELAIESLNSAIANLHNGDAIARAKHVTKAQEAVNELAMAVDHSSGASFTKQLVDLYAYVSTQIVKGHTEQSEAAFVNAISILKTLYDGWARLKPEIAMEPDSIRPPQNAFGYGHDTSDESQPRDWTA